MKPRKNKIVTFAIIILVLIIVIKALSSFMRNGDNSKNYETPWLLNKPIAHRGLHNDAIAENSIKSFENAINNKMTIELDVHMTKDNKVVVFHDRNLKRMTGLDKNIDECSYEEIKGLTLKDSIEKIPTFEEVLKFVNEKTSLLIEIKNEGKVGTLEEEVKKELQNYKGEYAVQSFNPFVLEWFKKNDPEVLRGQLVGSFKNEDMNGLKKFVLKNMLLNFKSRPNFIACEFKEGNKKFIDKQNVNGVPSICWTIRTKEDLKIALKEYSNAIFENIDAKDVFEIGIMEYSNSKTK